MDTCVSKQVMYFLFVKCKGEIQKVWSSSPGKLTDKSCFSFRKTQTTMVVMEIVT